MTMMQDIQRTLSQLMATPTGKKLTVEQRRKTLEDRQSLVARRVRIESAFRDQLPSRDAAIATARKTAEKQRDQSLAADHDLQVAHTAHRALVSAYDRDRDGINSQLRAASFPIIDAFLTELETRRNVVRNTGAGGHEEVNGAAGTRRVFSTMPGIARALEAITAARAGAEALRETAVEDMEQAVAALRAKIPPVGRAQLIRTETLARW